jgi:predicted metal-dependent hydrolase
MAERSKVQFGRVTIPFEVRRSARRRQVSLVVQPGQHGVLVYAPADTSLGRLSAVVRQRGAWAVAKLRLVELAEHPRQVREFVSGEGFTYLGRSLRLAVHVVPERKVHPARLERGWLVVQVPRGLGDAARRRAVRRMIVAWYRDRAAARLPERLERLTTKLDVPAPRLLLRDQARRWGSCNEKGEVRINWRIVQAPMLLVDYVLAHEAVHLKHTNHTRAYWTELGRLVPDVDARRAELRRRGGEYTW